MPVHLVPRSTRRISSVVILATAALTGGFAAPAMADTPSSIAVASTTATPEQAVPVDLAFSGTNALTANAEVEAVVRPAGGLACLASYQEDTSTFPAQDVAIFAPGAESVSPGAYDVSGSFKTPVAGSYQVCAWLAQNQNSTDQPVSSPATLTVAARGPQVSQLTVTVPKDLQPNVPFPVSYTTQTDQQLSLESVIYTTDQGPCPASFDANQQEGRVETVLSGFGSTSVFGGPATNTVTTKQRTGFYLVCTWIQGPNPGEVDGAASTPVTVGTPPPPAPKLKLTRAAAVVNSRIEDVCMALFYDGRPKLFSPPCDGCPAVISTDSSAWRSTISSSCSSSTRCAASCLGFRLSSCTGACSRVPLSRSSWATCSTRSRRRSWPSARDAPTSARSRTASIRSRSSPTCF